MIEVDGDGKKQNKKNSSREVNQQGATPWMLVHSLQHKSHKP